MRKTRNSLAMLIVLSLTVFAFTPLHGNLWAAESNTIRLIVPNAPGSGVDSTARAMSDQLAKALGKTVVVENLPGAGGIKGTQEIVRAPKDGFTIGMVSSNHVINPSIYKDLTYDAIKDVTPISILGTVQMVLITYPELPAANLKELIALAKSKPGKLTFGSAGNGSVLHLAGELFCSEADVKLTHVPYKGGSQLVADLLGGHVDMAFLAISTAVQQVKAGKLRAIGISTPKRSSAMPDVASLAESGLPNYSFDTWIAMIGPAQLPQPVVQRLNAAAKEALGTKDVMDAFAVQGTEIVGSTPEEAARVFEADLAKSARLVKQSGAKLD
jgi:tripartite-type tricarboxylate transporter receptor subunit TctC